MTTNEIIDQLEALKDHCKDYVDDTEDCPWNRDVQALDAAIDRLQGQPKRGEAALSIFALTAILGLIAACAGIVVALFGGYKVGAVLLVASCGWWLEALIAGRDCK